MFLLNCYHVKNNFSHIKNVRLLTLLVGQLSISPKTKNYFICFSTLHTVVSIISGRLHIKMKQSMKSHFTCQTIFSCLSKQFLARITCKVDQSSCWWSKSIWDLNTQPSSLSLWNHNTVTHLQTLLSRKPRLHHANRRFNSLILAMRFKRLREGP